jgi:hypothetical protein
MYSCRNRKWNDVPRKSSYLWRMMFSENVINLTNAHPWLSFEDAWILMKYTYFKFKPEEKYNTFRTLMSIEYGIFQRESELKLRQRILIAKKYFNYT